VADTRPLEGIVETITARLSAKNRAREVGLAASRAIVRLSANAIRAIHRDDRAEADRLLAEAARTRDEAVAALTGHPDIYHAGFMHDALKEFAEAHATVALLSGEPLPGPDALGVDYPAYLNGIAEAVGELRRGVLDRLRYGRYDECESLLQAMDDIYTALVTIDFPDAMTGGLRRTTDQTRGILERTRGDLTMAIVQRDAMRGMRDKG
jgi:translin